MSDRDFVRGADALMKRQAKKAFDRVTDEEINRAAEDGMEVLHFPFPASVAVTEQFMRNPYKAEQGMTEEEAQYEEDTEEIADARGSSIGEEVYYHDSSWIKVGEDEGGVTLVLLDRDTRMVTQDEADESAQEAMMYDSDEIRHSGSLDERFDLATFREHADSETLKAMSERELSDEWDENNDDWSEEDRDAMMYAIQEYAGRNFDMDYHLSGGGRDSVEEYTKPDGERFWIVGSVHQEYMEFPTAPPPQPEPEKGDENPEIVIDMAGMPKTHRRVLTNYKHQVERLQKIYPDAKKVILDNGPHLEIPLKKAEDPKTLYSGPVKVTAPRGVVGWQWRSPTKPGRGLMAIEEWLRGRGDEPVKPGAVVSEVGRLVSRGMAPESERTLVEEVIKEGRLQAPVSATAFADKIRWAAQHFDYELVVTDDPDGAPRYADVDAKFGIAQFPDYGVAEYRLPLGAWATLAVEAEPPQGHFGSRTIYWSRYRDTPAGTARGGRLIIELQSDAMTNRKFLKSASDMTRRQAKSYLDRITDEEINRAREDGLAFLDFPGASAVAATEGFLGDDEEVSEIDNVRDADIGEEVWYHGDRHIKVDDSDGGATVVRAYSETTIYNQEEADEAVDDYATGIDPEEHDVGELDIEDVLGDFGRTSVSAHYFPNGERFWIVDGSREEDFISYARATLDDGDIQWDDLDDTHKGVLRNYQKQWDRLVKLYPAAEEVVHDGGRHLRIPLKDAFSPKVVYSGPVKVTKPPRTVATRLPVGASELFSTSSSADADDIFPLTPVVVTTGPARFFRRPPRRPRRAARRGGCLGGRGALQRRREASPASEAGEKNPGVFQRKPHPAG